jgi:hypothetical protein
MEMMPKVDKLRSSPDCMYQRVIDQIKREVRERDLEFNKEYRKEISRVTDKLETRFRRFYSYDTLPKFG